MMRPLWTWQRWMAAATPKVFQDRLSAFASNEGPRQPRIEPPGEEIVDQGLDEPCSPSPPRTARTCLSLRRRSPPSGLADMQTVDLDD